MKRNRHSTNDGGMTKIGDLLSQLIVRHGLHRRRHMEEIEEAWRQAIGEQYATATHVEKLYQGTLTIKVPHNAYAQELSFRQSELVDILSTLLENEKIKKIRFVV
jgi:predicted nucleic acid-binding Zn ribbon protein